MWPIITLVTGLVIGFVGGWLVRDFLATDKRLLRPEDGFGLGVPQDWYRYQRQRQAH